MSESSFHPEDKAGNKIRNKGNPEQIEKPPIDLDEFWAKLDALGARDFLPDGIPDAPPAEPARAPSSMSDLMKDEYDFLAAKRGKFFREDARPVPPIHLAPEVLDYLSGRAVAQGVSLSSLVNTLLKKSIELIEAAKK